MFTQKSLATLTLLATLLVPFSAIAETTAADKFAAGVPFAQDLVVTAYYSPKIDQCCFVTGSFESDVTLNGQGLHGADGTAVYPGMVAAPARYPFGSRVVIPGLGSFTVHDRGGAIVEGKDSHRLDIWVGAGEEGLARALAFGVQSLKATVYPPKSAAPAEKFSLETLAAPLERLRPFFAAQTTLLSLSAAVGDRSASVQALQEKLGALGTFHETATGSFGPATQQALQEFLVQAGLSSEPTDRLTERSSATIEAALLRQDAAEPIAERIVPGSDESDVAALQRTLRFLDVYRGRTDGTFNDRLTKAVFDLQKAHGLVGTMQSPGAGTIGPKTRGVIVTLWKQRRLAMTADRLIARHRVDVLLAEKGIAPSEQLSKGETGTAVKVLQRFLAARGYFPSERVNGVYGDLTQASVLAYQKAEQIITKITERGAGTVGPTTLGRMREQAREKAILLVRARGWDAAMKVL